MSSKSKIQNIFDIALKQSKGGDRSKGYSFSDGRVYYSYCTNEEWSAYLKDMIEKHNKVYHEFIDGDGGELSEKASSSGKILPPKMASFASSSRFIFEESCQLGSQIEFECKLPIAFKGFRGEARASLDGFIPSRRIFIEAKCHEIYSNYSSEFKIAYNEFYNYLCAKTDGRLNFYTKTSGKKETVHFLWEGKMLNTLDLKQLLCHMLGIAKKALLEDCSETSTLIYLVYQPGENLLQFIPNAEDRKIVMKIWENERKEAECIDFKLLYKHIVNYISTEKKNWQGDLN